MFKENFKELYEKRRTIRKFLSDKIPDEDIKYMIDAARLAPSAENLQPWRFLAIRNRDFLLKMFKIIDNRIEEIFEKFPPNATEYFKQFRFFLTLFKDAPLVIVIVGKKIETAFPGERKNYNLPAGYCEKVDPIILSFGASVENILLAATALGYGSTWMTGPLQFHKDIDKFFNLKEGEFLASFISIGKPYKEKLPPPKKSIDELLTFID